MLHGDIPCQLRTVTYINYQFHKLQKVMGPDLSEFICFDWDK